jgi:hypothetical protein
MILDRHAGGERRPRSTDLGCETAHVAHDPDPNHALVGRRGRGKKQKDDSEALQGGEHRDFPEGGSAISAGAITPLFRARGNTREPSFSLDRDGRKALRPDRRAVQHLAVFERDGSSPRIAAQKPNVTNAPAMTTARSMASSMTKRAEADCRVRSACGILGAIEAFFELVRLLHKAG